MSDRDVKELFADVTFADEPPTATPVGAYIGIGQRRLRRRRWLRSAGLLGGAAIVAGGVITVVPGDDLAPPPTRLGVASAPSVPAESGAEPVESDGLEHPPLPDESSQLPFGQTRRLLLDVAQEYFDPKGEHLPSESTSFHSGPVRHAKEIGTKLSWTNPGESGEGMIYVAVTSPGYADAGEYALDGFADLAGGGDFDNFTEQTLPGTSATGWVYQGGTGDDLRLGVVVERDDGSLVGVGVYGLFGNNSLTGVSDISIDLESAAAYVTDPRLRIHDEDLAVERQWAEFIEWLTEQDSTTRQKVIDELKEQRDDLAHQLAKRWWRSSGELEEWGLVNRS